MSTRRIYGPTPATPATPATLEAAATLSSRPPLPPLWPWHLALGGAVLLLDGVLLLTCLHLAGAVAPIPWALPVACVAGGSLCGGLALAIWRERRVWRQALALVLAGGSGLIADGLLVQIARGAPGAVGVAVGAAAWIPLLLYVPAATVLAATLPLLLDHVRRACMGLAIYLAVCAAALSVPVASAVASAPASASPAAIGPLAAALATLAARDTGLVGWLACVAAVVALGIAWIRDEVRAWHRARVHLLGAGLFAVTVRPVMLLCILIAGLTALPVAVPHVPGLEQLWPHLDPLHGGTFASAQPGGSLAIEPGQPLALNAGAPANPAQALVRYTVLTDSAPGSVSPVPPTPALSPAPEASPLAGTGSAGDGANSGANSGTGDTVLTPPLVLTALTRFDGSAWLPDSTAAFRPATALASQPAATQVTARLTLLAPLPGGYLPGPDSPLFYAHVPGGVSALVSLSNSPLGVANPLAVDGWRATTPLAAGTTYTVSSAELSGAAAAAAPAAPVASLPADLLALPALPGDLLAQMQREATAWSAEANTPVAKAQAIATAMRARFTLDTHDAPLAGTLALRSFFALGEGSAAVWVTVHALLCRMVGVPVRLVEGFAPGTLDFATGTRIVHAGDFTLYAQVATALGWARVGVLDTVLPTTRVSTAPTPSPGVHSGGPATPTPAPTPTGAGPAPRAVRTTPPPPPSLPAPATLGFYLVVLVAVALLALLVAAVWWAVWWLVRRRRATGSGGWGGWGARVPWSRRSPQGQAVRLLASLVQPARRAGVPVTRGDTPLVFASRLAALPALPVAASREITALALAYTHVVYGGGARRDVVDLDPALLARSSVAARVARSALRARQPPYQGDTGSPGSAAAPAWPASPLSPQSQSSASGAHSSSPQTSQE